MPRLPNPASQRDLHAEITGKLIAAIEANPGEPQLPWRRADAPLHLPTNALTGRAYKGVNILSLWAATFMSGYSAPTWGTYRQWQELGAQVRKGEKGSFVIFYRELQVKADPENDNDDGIRRLARLSVVFNVDQVEGYKPAVVTAAEAFPAPTDHFTPLPRAEEFVSGTGAVIHCGGDEAYYDRRRDEIIVAPPETFIGTPTSTPQETYYGVLLHELAHWTGAPHRLNRTFGQRFGDQAYAAEELVAEIASAFLCAELEISSAPRADHAQYLAHWLELLKTDKRAIFVAAARASEAIEFLKGERVAPNARMRRDQRAPANI